MNSCSRMNIGDEEMKFVDVFMPVTPEKPILASSNSMGIDSHESQLGRENWQQLSGFKHLKQISNFNRMAQHFGQTDQMGRVGSSVQKNRMINQIAGSFAQTQALLNETVVWNIVPRTILNTSLSMADGPLFPNFHYPESSSAEFLSANQTHCSNSIALSHDGFPICNSVNAETYGASNVTNSFQFAPMTPPLTKKSVQNTSSHEREKQHNLVASVENFQDEHNFGQVLHSIVDSSSAVISTPVEEPKVATVCTLIEDPKDSSLASEAFIDLNKTPKQKTPKRRKHRPKVIVEGKPNRTPKAATMRIADPKQKTTEKRKYVRKKSHQESATQQPDTIGESTDSTEKPKENVRKDVKEPATQSAYHIGETAYATAEPAAHSCKRALHFDLENVSGDRESNLVAQQELLNKKTETSKQRTGFPVAESIKITNMICRTDLSDLSVRMSQQNEIMLEKSEEISNFIPCMNLMLDNNVSILGRTEAGTSYTSVSDKREAAIHLSSRKDVQMAHLNASARNTDIRKQQQIPAEGIGQIFVPIKENCRSIERTGHMMCHTNLQSVTEGSPYLTESRRTKREYCHVEQTNHSTTNPLRQETLHTDDFHINSVISKAVCSEACKKRKTGNGIQTNIDGMLASVAAVNHSREKASGNYVSSIASAPERNSEILNSYLESNNINRYPFDCYSRSVASGQDMPKQRMLSRHHSCTERTGETITSAMVQKLASNNTFVTHNMLPPTRPKTSSQPGGQLQPTRCNINVPMNRAMTAIQYQSVSSTKGKMLHPNISILKDQHSPGKRRERLAEQKFPITIEDIIYQMEYLNLNETKNEEQNALVPYKGDGTLIPLERFEVIKKHKPRPKVDLDPETMRVWKLLMWKEGSEGFEGTDQEKMQWWEEERRVFCGRADSFIARMHLVQGDRRFSKWKGSVVDSVIGVFLTQNVSDHLSSSAFMSLVARFPLKPTLDRTCERDGPIILVEEPYFCMPNLTGMDKLQKLWCSFYSHSSMTPHRLAEYQRDTKTSCKERTSIVQAHNHGSEEEVLSSEDSFDSSVIQSNGVTSYSGSNSEAEAPINGSKRYKNHSTCSDLPQAESTTSFKEFFSHVMFPEGSRHGHKQPAEIENQRHLPRSERLYDSLKGSYAFNQQIYYNNPLMQKPTVPSSNYQYITAQYGAPGVESSVLNRGESISSWPTSTSRSSKEKDTSYTSTRIEQGAESVARIMTPQYRSARYQETPMVESQSTAKPVNLADAQTNRQPLSNIPRLSEEVFDVEARIHLVDNKQTHSKNKLVESNSIDQVDCTNKANLNANTIKAREERGKPNDKKKNSVDWDSFRKQVLANGGRKERSKDETDSLDYEAMRCANINEISDAIKERGMNNMLAERIKEFLNRLVREHGSIDLEWLRDVPPDIAKDYLLSIRGLGLKSVECVRLLTLHHLAFPVDTNVGRIAVRLGWVPLQPLPESLQLHLLELYPVLESIQKYLWPRLCKLDQRTLYELHYQMITFGKVFCTKSRPNCNACPMRAECRHFASAFASARFALPGPEEKSVVTQTVLWPTERSPGIVIDPMQLPPPEDNSTKRVRSDIFSCTPIIEEPVSPEQQHIEVIRSDIEDVFNNDPDEIPTIKLNIEELSVNLQSYMQANMELQQCDMSKALVALHPEAASIPTPKLKNVSRLRTEHQVYELPDSHPLLHGMDKREPDDPSPYLLAIWTPGETADSIQQPGHCQSQGEPDRLCNQKTCFSCNSIREANSQIVRGTLLIPCRTAMRGSFPLNGTYFQVNEMFADHASSINPIDVPRAWIWNLPRRTVYFGTSVPTIFKGLSTERIQYCFWKGFVCVRGFDQKTRAPRPLVARLHFPASKLAKRK